MSPPVIVEGAACPVRCAARWSYNLANPHRISRAGHQRVNSCQMPSSPTRLFQRKSPPIRISNRPLKIERRRGLPLAIGSSCSLLKNPQRHSLAGRKGSPRAVALLPRNKSAAAAAGKSSHGWGCHSNPAVASEEFLRAFHMRQRKLPHEPMCPSVEANASASFNKPITTSNTGHRAPMP